MGMCCHPPPPRVDASESPNSSSVSNERPFVHVNSERPPEVEPYARNAELSEELRNREEEKVGCKLALTKAITELCLSCLCTNHLTLPRSTGSRLVLSFMVHLRNLLRKKRERAAISTFRLRSCALCATDSSQRPPRSAVDIPCAGPVRTRSECSENSFFYAF